MPVIKKLPLYTRENIAPRFALARPIFSDEIVRSATTEHIESVTRPHLWGLTFHLSLSLDHDHEPPWDNDDLGRFMEQRGTYHGQRLDKRPGQIVIAGGMRSDPWLFDYAEATAWLKDQYAEYHNKPRWPAPSAAHRRIGMSLRECVKHDLDATLARWRGWIDDEWTYLGVNVAVNYHDVPITNANIGTYWHSIWGIESDCHDYLVETAHDQAWEAVHTLIDRVEATYSIRHPERRDVRAVIVEFKEHRQVRAHCAISVQHRVGVMWESLNDCGLVPDVYQSAPTLMEAVSRAYALMSEY